MSARNYLLSILKSLKRCRHVIRIENPLPGLKPWLNLPKWSFRLITPVAQPPILTTKWFWNARLPPKLTSSSREIKNTCCVARILKVLKSFPAPSYLQRSEKIGSHKCDRVWPGASISWPITPASSTQSCLAACATSLCRRVAGEVHDDQIVGAHFWRALDDFGDRVGGLQRRDDAFEARASFWKASSALSSVA